MNQVLFLNTIEKLSQDVKLDAYRFVLICFLTSKSHFVIFVEL